MSIWQPPAYHHLAQFKETCMGQGIKLVVISTEGKHFWSMIDTNTCAFNTRYVCSVVLLMMCYFHLLARADIQLTLTYNFDLNILDHAKVQVHTSVSLFLHQSGNTYTERHTVTRCQNYYTCHLANIGCNRWLRAEASILLPHWNIQGHGLKCLCMFYHDFRRDGWLGRGKTGRSGQQEARREKQITSTNFYCKLHYIQV